jgi:hypothetical protein
MTLRPLPFPSWSLLLQLLWYVDSGLARWDSVTTYPG